MSREGRKKSMKNDSFTPIPFLLIFAHIADQRSHYNELCYLRTRRRAEMSSFNSICQYLDEGSGARGYTQLAKSKESGFECLKTSYDTGWKKSRYHLQKAPLIVLEPRSTISFLPRVFKWRKIPSVSCRYDDDINEFNPCKQIIKWVYLHVRKEHFCVSLMT